jgi:hypothetical protein
VLFTSYELRYLDSKVRIISLNDQKTLIWLQTASQSEKHQFLRMCHYLKKTQGSSSVQVTPRASKAPVPPHPVPVPNFTEKKQATGVSPRAKHVKV